MRPNPIKTACMWRLSPSASRGVRRRKAALDPLLYLDKIILELNQSVFKKQEDKMVSKLIEKNSEDKGSDLCWPGSDVKLYSGACDKEGVR